MKKIILLAAATFNFASIHAQYTGNVQYAEGNAVYDRYNSQYGYQNYVPQTNPQYHLATDSTYYITARVLMNVKADAYMAVFAVHEDAPTVKECNAKINKRIEAFKTDLKALKISDSDIFVDMVAQHRIYDYKADGKNQQEVAVGFELKKNIIIKFSDVKNMDEIMVIASEYEIYDIVKVEYILTQQEALYKQMMENAVSLINDKKQMLLKNSSFELLPEYKISNENFYTVYPEDAYKNYTAYETSTANYYNYNNNEPAWKKELRKTKTFYFDQMSYSGFDRIINPVSPEVPVQMVLEVTMKYEIKREEKSKTPVDKKNK